MNRPGFRSRPARRLKDPSRNVDKDRGPAVTMGEVRAHALAGCRHCSAGRPGLGADGRPCRCATRRFLKAHPEVILDKLGNAWWPVDRVPPAEPNDGSVVKVFAADSLVLKCGTHVVTWEDISWRPAIEPGGDAALDAGCACPEQAVVPGQAEYAGGCQVHELVAVGFDAADVCPECMHVRHSPCGQVPGERCYCLLPPNEDPADYETAARG